jgi:hypothetical protein
MLVKFLAKLAPEVYCERSTVEHVHSGFVWIEGSTPPAALPVPFRGDFNQDFGLAMPREEVLAWRLSNTIYTAFCLAALDEALAGFGTPDIFNTDQGAQFTSARCSRAGLRPPASQSRWTAAAAGWIRAGLALAQIRGGASQRLCGRPRGARRHRRMDDFLQYSSLSPVTRL